MLTYTCFGYRPIDVGPYQLKFSVTKIVEWTAESLLRFLYSSFWIGLDSPLKFSSLSIKNSLPQCLLFWKLVPPVRETLYTYVMIASKTFYNVLIRIRAFDSSSENLRLLEFLVQNFLNNTILRYCASFDCKVNRISEKGFSSLTLLLFRYCRNTRSIKTIF